jgi:NADPH:quinone reductase-like Zn-dependent oxidoreductase
MKAIVYTEHGPPDVLKLTEVPVPVPKDDEVLIRVRAASLNPLDWHLLRAEPAFLKMMAKKAAGIPGVDVAGVVERVGAKVTQLRPGDDVCGGAWRALAECTCTAEDRLVRKPPRLSFEQAAAISCAGLTALQAVRDHGRTQPGQRVLINGASGGVGTFAVQIARALGAEVTGVCSTRNLELVRSLGAHHVIDYTVEDFTKSKTKYDVVVHTAGNRTNTELRRALEPRGHLVLVGGGTGREEDAPIGILDVLGAFAGNFLAPVMRQKTRMMMTKPRKNDLLFLAELIEAGKLTPVIDRAYQLAEAAEAIRYLEAGHARGKVVVTI